MSISRKKIIAVMIFMVVLAVLFAKNKYRVPTAIQTTGHYSKPIFVNYFWDSGSGYNGDEETNGWLGKYQDFEEKTHSLEIGMTPSSTASPPSGKVQVLQILLNKKTGIPDGKTQQDVNSLEQKIKISRGHAIKMEAIFTNFVLITENGSSAAELYIKVDAQVFNVTLARPRMISVIRVRKFIPGPAVNRLELPRLRLHGVRVDIFEHNSAGKIEKLEFLSNAPAIRLPLPKPEGYRRTISIDPKYLRNSKFHFLLFAVQVSLSFLAAWLWRELLLLIGRSQSHNIGAFLKWTFLAGQRWVFWGIFFFSFVFYSLWLLGQWPGEMNWDTFVMWGETQTLRLTNNHSFVYVLLLCLVKQLRDSPASMALLQIAFMSFLLARIFFFAFKNGAPKRWLVLVCILVITSVPLAVSTISVNTTTLFALLTAFWGFTLFRLAFLKKRGRPLIFSNKELCVLAVFFCLLVSIRHHALVYIIILPALAWTMKVFPLHSFKRFMAYFALVFLVLHLAVATVLGIPERTNYGPRLKAFKLPSIMQIIVHESEIKKAADVRPSITDTFRDEFPGDISGPQKEWSKEKKETFWNFINGVQNNLPLYLAYRVLVFAEALGLSDATVLYFMRGKEVETIKMSRPLSLRPLINRPILPAIANWQQTLLRETSSFKHLVKPRLIFWNTGIPLIILLLVLALYRRLPLSACASFLILSQLPFLFIALPSGQWRYLYFIYLFGIVVLPLVIIEFRWTATSRQNGGAPSHPRS
jgi:hypothetical protein